jgi:hypothetical protein
MISLLRIISPEYHIYTPVHCLHGTRLLPEELRIMSDDVPEPLSVPQVENLRYGSPERLRYFGRSVLRKNATARWKSSGHGDSKERRWPVLGWLNSRSLA